MDARGVPEAVAWWLESARLGTLRGDYFVAADSLSVPVSSVSLAGLGAGTFAHDMELAAAASGASVVATRSDASGDADAFSAIEEGRAVHGASTADQRAWSIDAKEMYAIFVMLVCFGALYAGRALAVGTDNAGNQFAINTARCPSSTTRRILAAIYDICDQLRINLFAVWIPRAFNRPADLLCKSASFSAACSHAAEAELGLEMHSWNGGK